MNDFETTAEDGAVNVYQNDMADEFPVLKAFQQYIDSEQAKARKRMLMLCVFFSFVLMAVIGVFVSLLIASSSRNQSLNDRLVEYAMKDRDRSPVPAQTQSSHEDPALRALTEKLESLQKTLAEDQARAKKAEEEAERKKRSTAETLEIERLKALLAAEKEKAAAEREKQRQTELEEYRRKHYPELYGLKPNKAPSLSSRTSISHKSTLSEDEAAADREIESIINDIKAIDYFDEEDAEERMNPSTRSSKSQRKIQKKDVTPSSEDDVEIPNDVKDSSGNTWSIPEE